MNYLDNPRPNLYKSVELSSQKSWRYNSATSLSPATHHLQGFPPRSTTGVVSARGLRISRMVTGAQSTVCGLRASTTRVPEPAASSADQMAYATGGTALVAQGSWVQRGDELYFVPYPAVASVVIKAFANEAAGISGGWLRSRIFDRWRGNAYYGRLTPPTQPVQGQLG